MKIVILDGYTENPGDLSWEGFEKLGEVRIYDRTPHDPAVIVERIGNAEAVITNKTPLTAETLALCPSVKYIGVLATGYNIVDTAAAAERGIAVCNIPSYCAESVAQLTFALLLEICHHAGHHSDAVHAGKWSSSIDFCFWDFPLIELMGKTMGIVGYGRIGKATAKIASAFGMKVLAYSRHMPETGDGVVEFVSLPELLVQSDVVSLHCPLNAESEKLINEEALRQMKDGAILLNTSRGGLLDEAAVADALKTGKLYAAGVDVVSVEPVSEQNPLLGAENCIITPHIAWAPKDCRIRLMDMAVENLRSFLEGKTINRVN